MVTVTWIVPLKKLRPCSDAVEWAKTFGALDDAWKACERGDWMLWLLGKQAGPPESDSRKKLVLTACACARLALPHVKKGDRRSLKAIETAEAWARGDTGVTLQMVRDAAAADAYAAAYAAAAYAAAYAATYAAYAAYAAADAAARKSILAKCADIVREHYPSITL